MEKFWNKAADGSAELYIYGDIVSWKFDDTDTTAKSFVEDLNSFGGKPVTLHLNSGGGDVFQALAIYNAIKNYAGGVTVTIDGLAASAASLVAMGGKKVTMAKNAMMMIHEPAIGASGFFALKDLSQMETRLTAVRQSVIDTYKSRVNDVDVEELVSAETWLSAKKALELGFADEIAGEVDLKIDNAQGMLFVNSLSVPMKNYDATKMRQAMEDNKMDDKNFFDKLKESITEALTLKDKSEAEPAPAPAVVDAAAIRQQELTRIRNLQALKCENAAINAIIDVAMTDGREVKDVEPYIAALKKGSISTANDTADKIVAVIRDQMQSGAEGVKGGQEVNADDAKQIQMKRIAEIANGLI